MFIYLCRCGSGIFEASSRASHEGPVNLKRPLRTSKGLPSRPVTNFPERFSSALRPSARAVVMLQTVKGAPKSKIPKHLTSLMVLDSGISETGL